MDTRSCPLPAVGCFGQLEAMLLQESQQAESVDWSLEGLANDLTSVEVGLLCRYLHSMSAMR